MTVKIESLNRRLLPLLSLCLTACPNSVDPAASAETSTGEMSSGKEDTLVPTTGGDTSEGSSASEEDVVTETGDGSSTSAGATESGDATTTSDEVEAVCGDGHLDEGEACDDGFADNTLTGACLPDCTLARCGDGFVHGDAEDCDLGDGGNSYAYGGCNPVTCRWGPRCGDGQVDAPNEVCDPGDPGGQRDGLIGCAQTCRFLGRIVFLSSKAYDGHLGGLAGADKLCRDLAAKFDAAHSSTYRAWLSDGEESPYSRFTHGPEFDGVPYVLRSGVPIAADFTALTTQGPWPGIDLTDDDQVLVEKHVWTNTGVDGQRLSPDDHCKSWTTNSGDEGAQYGFNSLPANSPELATWLEFGQWTSVEGNACSKKNHLYCFEN